MDQKVDKVELQSETGLETNGRSQFRSGKTLICLGGSRKGVHFGRRLPGGTRNSGFCPKKLGIKVPVANKFHLFGGNHHMFSTKKTASDPPGDLAGGFAVATP